MDKHKRAATPNTMAMAIPVITRSPQPGRIPFKQPKPRQTRSYAPGPLPTKLSSTAPRNARITARIISPLSGTVHYDLSIGDVALPDVSVEEILEYVSPLELEAWEHRQFEEERGVLEAYERAREEERVTLAVERRERAKLRGVGGWEEVSSSEEEGSGSEAEEGDAEAEAEAEVGKHGRARPTYTHLFKVPEMQRRRRVRSSTEEEEEGRRVTSTTEDERVVRSNESVPAASLTGVPQKRRRRKRDKITGELLPLSPRGEQQQQQQQQVAPKGKRPRRRRHPITGELMPLGWRYDPSTDDRTRRNFDHENSHVSPDSFQHLRISPTAKRQRLDTESSMSRSISPAPSKMKVAEWVLVSTPCKTSPAKTLSKLDLSPRPAVPASVQPTPRLSQPAQVIDITSSPEPEISAARTKSPPPTHTSPPIARTSLIHPTAPLSSTSSSTAEDSDDNDEDEWVVESILSHQYSDPKTHPASAGTKPIMLYQTKWAGSNEMTWEPLESFGDWDIVRRYRRRAGLRSEPSDDGNGQADRHNGDGNDDDEEDYNDDEFEIEAIHSHHLSDPRTHPVELGKTPVMLYEVKWKGWEETTWEPVGSFVDARILDEYHRRVRL